MTAVLSVNAPRQVRGALETRYAGTVDRALLDDIIVMASELTTNAVLYSGCPTGDPLALTAQFRDGVFRFQIIDRGRGLKDLQPRSFGPPSGLAIVDLLSDRWDSHHETSFHVWFEIDIADGTPLSRRPNQDRLAV